MKTRHRDPGRARFNDRGTASSLGWDSEVARVAILSLLLMSAVPAFADSRPAASAVVPAPGTTIDQTNFRKFGALVPQALGFAIQHGLVVHVVPARSIEWPSEYRRATEQYSSQVRLDAQNVMRNYVAGLPFPLLQPMDSNRAVKIAYNWHWGPFIPPQVTLMAEQKERAWKIDPNQPTKLINDDAHADFRNNGSCQQIVILRFTHTLHWLADPHRSDSPVEYKQRGDYCGPEPNAYIMVQYMDPDRNSDSWFFPEAVRRWRRMKLRGGYPHQSCTYACAQFWWEYVPPKTEAYTYRLVKEQPLLACLDAKRAGAGIDVGGDATRFGALDCEVRSAYVLEMLPRPAPEKILRSMVFIDKETYLCLGALYYREESSPEALVPIWSRQKADSGETRMVLADDYYVPSDVPGFFLSLNMQDEPNVLDADEPSLNLFNPRIEGFRLH